MVASNLRRSVNRMHRKALIQRIGLFLFLIVAEGAGKEFYCSLLINLMLQRTKENVFQIFVLTGVHVLWKSEEMMRPLSLNGKHWMIKLKHNIFSLCVDGFTGTLCEEALHCNLDCQNGGECRYKNQRPLCSCKQGKTKCFNASQSILRIWRRSLSREGWMSTEWMSKRRDVSSQSHIPSHRLFQMLV